LRQRQLFWHKISRPVPPERSLTRERLSRNSRPWLVLGAVGVFILTDGLRIVSGAVAPKPGVPVGMILFLGSAVLIAAAGDFRMLVRGGVFFGLQQIARHLWRMCFGLLIATGSFLGQRRVITFLAGPEVLLLAALPLILMIFWLIRVRFKNVYKALKLN
jgi:hypothetical protein